MKWPFTKSASDNMPAHPNPTAYDFVPSQDITAFELAEILRICQKPVISFSYPKLPDALRRHWRAI